MVLPVIFVSFVEPDGTEPPCEKGTVNGKGWRRQKGEAEKAFLKRVAAEVQTRRTDCMALAFLE